MKQTYLLLSWSISRGVETQGYNICRLNDTQTDRRYRCMGGGYDMVGTVFGNWLKDRFQDALISANVSQLYGACLRSDGTVGLDGASGLESMLAIAQKAGLQITNTYNKKGQITGFIVNYE